MTVNITYRWIRGRLHDVTTRPDHSITITQVVDRRPEGPPPMTRTCRACGCTDATPCWVDRLPCHWVGPDLCSACEREAS